MPVDHDPELGLLWDDSGRLIEPKLGWFIQHEHPLGEPKVSTLDGLSDTEKRVLRELGIEYGFYGPPHRVDKKVKEAAQQLYEALQGKTLITNEQRAQSAKAVRLSDTGSMSPHAHETTALDKPQLIRRMESLLGKGSFLWSALDNNCVVIETGVGVLDRLVTLAEYGRDGKP